MMSTAVRQVLIKQILQAELSNTTDTEEKSEVTDRNKFFSTGR